MTYQVLARTYRPQSFFDVVGQDAVVQTITRALSTGRIAHAFLFTGSRGVGKTTLARILARCLTCEQGPTSRPCGVCRMCTSITAGQAVDIVEIDGASNTGVDQIRDLQEQARFLPQLARFKIFIIDEVHMLTTSAFNALLKILEEPPPHLKFVFATTEPHKIPVTVLSRCQRYDFRRIPSQTIIARLRTVLDAEDIAVDDAGLDVIARAAEGGMRDALSLTDQVLSFAGAVARTAGGQPITAEQVIDALGLIDRRTIAAATDAVITGDSRGALQVVELAFSRGFDLKQLITLVAEELRHIAVAQATGTIKGFADLADDDTARIDARARAVDPKDVVRVLGMAIDGIDLVGRAEDPRLALELALLKLCRRPPIGDALAISEALIRLERLSKGQPVPPLVERAAPTSTTAMGIASLAFVPVALPTPTAPPAQHTTSATTAAPSASPTATPSAASSATTTSGPAHGSTSHVTAKTPLISAGEPAPSSSALPLAAQPVTAQPVAPPSSAAPSVAPTSTEASLFPDVGEDEPVIAAPRPSPIAPSVDGGDDDDAPQTATSGAHQGAPSLALVEDSDDEEDDDPLFGLELPGVDERWRRFVNTLQLQRGGTFRMGRPRTLSNDTVEVCFIQGFTAENARRMAESPDVKEALRASFGDAELTIVHADDGGPSVHEAEQRLHAELQARLEAHARSHPVVQKAVTLFGGEVKTVKRT
jgi:DNA polymerase-3 subunit gamma/tau